MKIPLVKLADNTEIPQLGLGTWQLTGEECIRAVRTALELGYRHFDTADYYQNHKEVRKGLEGYPRNNLFITTKVWRTDLSASTLMKAVDRFLKELGTTYINLLLIHWPNKAVPLEETLTAMAQLVKLGKVRSIGVSNFPKTRILEAIKVSPMPIVTNQVEFHPFLYQQELLKTCKENHITLTAYSPLARGHVFKDTALKNIATKHKVTPGQVALKWMIDKGIIVIPKATTAEHLKENMESFNLQLDETDITLLDALPQQRLIHPGFAEF